MRLSSAASQVSLTTGRRRTARKFPLTIVVLGPPGSGKTSLVSSLVGRKVNTPNISANTKGPKLTNHPVECTHPDFSATLIDVHNFAVQPDISPDIDAIERDLETRMDDVLAEQNRIRRNPRFKDTRVHAIVYLVEPGHALKERDVEIMERLSRLTNIVPVLSRADSMTPDELAVARKTLAADLKTYKIPVFELDNSPLYIISGTVYARDGTALLKTRLPYAELDASDNSISCLESLKDQLLGVYPLDLCDSSDTLYEAHRTRRLMDPEARYSVMQPEEMVATATRLKEEQLAREEQQLKEQEARVQQEIETKRKELQVREAELRRIEERLKKEKLAEEQKLAEERRVQQERVAQQQRALEEKLQEEKRVQAEMQAKEQNRIQQQKAAEANALKEKAAQEMAQAGTQHNSSPRLPNEPEVQERSASQRSGSQKSTRSSNSTGPPTPLMNTRAAPPIPQSGTPKSAPPVPPSNTSKVAPSVPASSTPKAAPPVPASSTPKVAPPVPPSSTPKAAPPVPPASTAKVAPPVPTSGTPKAAPPVPPSSTPKVVPPIPSSTPKVVPQVPTSSTAKSAPPVPQASTPKIGSPPLTSPKLPSTPKSDHTSPPGRSPSQSRSPSGPRSMAASNLPFLPPLKSPSSVRSPSSSSKSSNSKMSPKSGEVTHIDVRKPPPMVARSQEAQAQNTAAAAARVAASPPRKATAAASYGVAGIPGTPDAKSNKFDAPARAAPPPPVPSKNAAYAAERLADAEDDSDSRGSRSSFVASPLMEDKMPGAFPATLASPVQNFEHNPASDDELTTAPNSTVVLNAPPPNKRISTNSSVYDDSPSLPPRSPNRPLSYIEPMPPLSITKKQSVTKLPYVPSGTS